MVKRIGLAGLAWMLVAVSFLLAVAQPLGAKAAPDSSGFTHFITKSGHTLKDGDADFRFISAAVPNLGMVEDIEWRIPTPWEQEDAFKSLAQMGGTATRPYVLSVQKPEDTAEQRAIMAPASPGGPLRFNEAVFVAMDHMLALANQYGVRLLVPFIDEYQWHGGIAELASFRGKTKDQFWTDEQLKADFKSIIAYTLNRTNTVTGVPYKEDKAILAWETGNELVPKAAGWTPEMASYIKSLDPNHLVADGKYGIDDASLADANIDIVSNHYYPDHYADYAAQANLDMAKAKAADKAFIIGEFGFRPTAEVATFLDSVIENGTAGALVWSLRFHNRDGGFYPHVEGIRDGVLYKSYHWPGFPEGEAQDETALLNLIRTKAYAIRGIAAPPPLPVPDAPTFLPIDAVSTMSWQGAAGAQSYTVERAESADGPWTMAGAGIYDSVPGETQLFHDTAAVTGQVYWYRVQAVNGSGQSGYSNVQGPVTAKHVIRDDLRNYSRMYDFSGDLEWEGKQPSRYGGDPARFKMLPTEEPQYIVYALPRTASATDSVYGVQVQATAYFAPGTAVDYTLLESEDGVSYIPLQAQRTDEAGEWSKAVYTADLSRTAKFVKIGFPADDAASQLGQVVIEYETNGMPLVFPDPIQTPDLISGLLTDELNNFSKMYEHSASLAFDTGNDGYFGGDAKRLNRWENTSASFVYRAGGDMNYFKLLTYAKQDPGQGYTVGDFKMYTSPDGVTYTEYGSAVKSSVGGEGWWTRIEYVGYKLPAGTRFLKFEFPLTTDEAKWNPQVSKVTIGVGAERLEPPAELAKTQVIEGFEGYSGSSNSLRSAYQINSDGSAITLTLDNVMKSEGNYGLKLETAMEQGWGGMDKALAGADWSGNSGIRFWVNPNGADSLGLTIQFKESGDTDGEVWKTEYRVSGSEPMMVQIPFNRFFIPDWWKSSHPSMGNGKVDLGKIESFGLYLDGAEGSYTVYLDDFRLYRLPVVDFFETYEGDNAKLQAAYTVNSGGDSIVPVLTGEFKHEGQFGLKLEYALTDERGYAGLTKSMDGIDWTGYNGIRFWYQPDGQERGLTVQFKETSGEFWEAKLLLKGTEEQLVQIPFHLFTQPGWNQAVNGRVDMQAIDEFSLYVEKGNGGAGQGALYFDSIEAAKLTVVDNFEFYQGSDSQVQAMYSRNEGGDDIAVFLDHAHRAEGDYGLKLVYTLTEGKGYAGVAKSLGAQDWTFGGNAFQFWLQPDGSGNGLTIQLKEADGDFWEAQLEPEGTAGRLVQIPFSSLARNAWSTGDGKLTLSNMQEYSIFVNKGNGSLGEHTLYLDQFSLGSSPLLDTFDYYNGGELTAQKAYAANEWGGSVKLYPDGEHKLEGKFGLRYEYFMGMANGETKNYAGVTKHVNGMSWSDYSGISLWLEPNATDHTLVVQFKESDGETWETYYRLSGREALTLHLPFSGFSKASWNTVGNGSIDLDSVSEFSLYVNQDAGPLAGGVLYFDSLKLYKASELPNPNPNPDPDPNPNPGPTPDSDPDQEAAEPELSGHRQKVERKALLGGQADEEVVIALAAGKTEAVLPADAADLLGSRTLALQAGAARIAVPAQVFRELAAGLSGEQLEQASIRLGAAPSASIEPGRVPPELKLAGGLYTLKLELVAGDGAIRTLDVFPQPVTLTLPVAEGSSSGLLGIYSYSEASREWKYMGGTVEQGLISVQLRQPSQYAAAEYRKSYTDVPAEHWAHSAIARLTAMHIVEGMEQARFLPDQPVTRAEFAKMMAGALKLEVQEPAPFADVASGDWFGPAVAAVHEHKLFEGKSAELFAPGDGMTRQELAAVLARVWADRNGGQPSGQGAASPYADEGDIDLWAREYVYAARTAGLMTGRGNGLFAPGARVTRAEAAQAIVNVLQSMN